jgi:hypothetical protein
MICIASVSGFLSLGFIAFGVMLCLEIDTPGRHSILQNLHEL